MGSGKARRALFRPHRCMRATETTPPGPSALAGSSRSSMRTRPALSRVTRKSTSPPPLPPRASPLESDCAQGKLCLSVSMTYHISTDRHFWTTVSSTSWRQTKIGYVAIRCHYRFVLKCIPYFYIVANAACGGRGLMTMARIGGHIKVTAEGAASEDNDCHW